MYENMFIYFDIINYLMNRNSVIIYVLPPLYKYGASFYFILCYVILLKSNQINMFIYRNLCCNKVNSFFK